MPMSVTYATVNGRLMEENRNGVVTRYIPDTLGNVIKTTDANGNITSETTYWPYGEIRTQTGTNPSPFGFCGIWGYLQDTASRLYVRARYYRPNLSRWMTVDPLWPEEDAYGYVRNTPLFAVDPSGLAILPLLCAGACIAAAGCALGIWIACKDWQGAWNSFSECAWNYINSLPPVSKIGCAIGLAGCIACLVKYARRLIAARRKKPLECAALLASYKAGCPNLDDIDKKVGICTESDNCTTLGIKAAMFESCAAARRLYKIKCVPKCKWDEGHDKAIKKNVDQAAICASLFARQCAKWS